MQNIWYLKLMFECGNIREHPDVAQGFMRIISHLLRKQLHLLQEIPNGMGGGQTISPVDITLLFHCGIATLSLLDSESVKAATNFFVDLIALYSNHSDVAVVLNQLGKTLLIDLLKTIGGAAPRTVMDNVSDTLFILIKSNMAQYSMWIREVMQLPNIPCNTVDNDRKEMFVKQVLMERHSKRKFREIVKDFSLVCRGLHGTEYAAG